MTQEISNSDDVIDSRDVIARIEELESERSTLSDTVAEWREHDLPDPLAAAEKALAEWDSDYGDELKALQALASEGESYADDWRHGATLVRDSYFTTYAQEFAEEIGAIPSDSKWPCTCIDWDKAASELRMDYTSIDFDGVGYWVR